MSKVQRRTLSKRVDDELTAREKEYICWDSALPGFGVRVYPGGAKTYLVQRRGPRGSKRIALGRHGTISAEEARQQAAVLLPRIEAGSEPGAAPDSKAVDTLDGS